MYIYIILLQIGLGSLAGIIGVLDIGSYDNPEDVCEHLEDVCEHSQKIIFYLRIGGALERREGSATWRNPAAPPRRTTATWPAPTPNIMNMEI